MIFAVTSALAKALPVAVVNTSKLAVASSVATVFALASISAIKIGVAVAVPLTDTLAVTVDNILKQDADTVALILPLATTVTS